MSIYNITAKRGRECLDVGAHEKKGGENGRTSLTFRLMSTCSPSIMPIIISSICRTIKAISR